MVTPKDIFVRRPDGSIPAPHGKALLKHSNQGHTLSSSVSVSRTGSAGDSAFQACIRIGSGKFSTFKGAPKKQTSGFTTACAFGRNPREALRKMLATAARKMKTRQGTFA